MPIIHKRYGKGGKMIETGKQTRAALREIMVLTEWTGAGAGDKLGISRATIGKILSGITKNPSAKIMEKVEKELIRVRRIHK